MLNTVPAVLIRELRVRIINISAAGVLVEADRRITVGTLGRLRLAFAGGECIEDVDVVRCRKIEGTGLHHIGMRFLLTTARHPQSIRRALARFVTDPRGKRNTSWFS